jgi:hypothetical protein
MNHRRLRLPAAMALMAVAASVLAAEPAGSERPGVVANLQRDAREFRDTVHENTVQFGHELTRSVHQARHQFTLGWHRAGTSIRHWWDNARETVARI